MQRPGWATHILVTDFASLRRAVTGPDLLRVLLVEFLEVLREPVGKQPSAANRLHQTRRVMPPSQMMLAPVTKDALSLARKVTRLATSEAAPRRRKAIVCRVCAYF